MAERHSPRAFAEEAVDDETVTALFEAARWSPSCFNDQPWQYAVARRGSAPFAGIVEALSEGNKKWVPAAPLLVVAYAATARADGSPNRYAWHDVGLANAMLTIEAASRGLGVHQMAGFSSEALRTAIPVPAGYDPVVVLAIGRPGPADLLPEPLASREAAPRRRKPLDEVFHRLDGDA